MPKVNYKAILEEYKARGIKIANANLRECLNDDGGLDANDFDFGRLFIECFGWQAFTDCRNGASAVESMLEAGSAVTASQFSNISGQVIFNKIMEGFNAEAFVFSGLVETIPTMIRDGEKIPGIGAIGDKSEIVGEMGIYPKVGLNEDFIRTPPLVKRGMICPVTREAAFFDRTGRVLAMANEVGHFLGLNKEKEVIDMVIDENRTGHRYNRRDVGAVKNYDDNTGNHDWDNLQASNTLVDWTDIEAAELLFAAITDPNTDEPVEVEADSLVVAPQLAHTARRIVNATEIRFGDGASSTTQAISRNPIQPYTIHSSRLLADRMATKTSWFLGNLRKAFAYMQGWAIETMQAPPNAQAEFEQDIISQFKGSMMGAAAVLQPRYVVKSTVAA